MVSETVSEDRDHVLIADDQPENVLILDSVLGDLYTVHGASDGEAALVYVRSGAPVDLILLDVLMPGLDGFEVCRQLKADPATRDIPILFLTGLNSDADEARGLSLGAEDFIHKPISPSVVLARVRNHLRLRRATRLLRERSEDMERLATDAAGLGIWDYDVASNHMAWNDQMFRQYGISKPGFTNGFVDLFSNIHPDDIERMKREYSVALEGERDIVSEFRVVRPDGDIRVLKASATIRRDASGNPVRLLGTNWDVTDYRRALEDLNRAKTQAEAANVAKSNFLAAMSHELRTPLNAIIGFGQLLHAMETRPDVLEQLDIICQAANSLLKIIQDILDISKIESGRVVIDHQVFDLEDELRLVGRYFAPEVRRKKLDYKVSIAPDLPLRLIGDCGMLRQILVNLIGNAVKFTARGGIEVMAETVDRSRPDGKLVLAFHVVDTGPGIREDSQTRIFDIFEQEDNSSTRRYGGVGLGLAIAKRLVNLMGGKLWLRSTPGVGSRFSFTALVEPAYAHSERQRSGAWALSGTVNGGASVLVVEDDRFSRKLIVGLLSKAGHHVLFAEDGLAALDMLRTRSFDLVLMDIQLPEIDGLDLTRRIRAGTIPGCDPALPIIALTAHALREDKARCLNHGVTAYCSKPISVNEFLDLVQNTLKGESESGS